MFDISNEGNITVNRGDSFQTPIFINKGTEINPNRYELTEDDTLYFAVMEPNQRFEDALIKKVYDKDSEKNEKGDILIKFDPIDTEYVLPGEYRYTVKLRTITPTEIPDLNIEEVQTIVPEKVFFIAK